MTSSTSAPQGGQKDFLESHIFEELAVGQSATLVRQLTERDIEAFAAISGDVNPLMVDKRFAQTHEFHHPIAHGMWVGALISNVLGTQLPGPGTVYVHQDLDFERPIGLGDTITVTVSVEEKQPETGHIVLACRCADQNGQLAVSGRAMVLPPREKLRQRRPDLPELTLRDRGERLRRIIERAADLEPLAMAVVHPVDDASLLGTVRAAEAGLIAPILVGPAERIQEAAKRASVDISRYRIVAADHSHEAATKAVALVRAGEVNALMKGKLHTDELMHAVLEHEAGLRTERRLSHVFVMDIPDYSKPLLITDAGINITPTLEEKVDILQNAIDLANALGTDQPKAAILCAVETVDASMPCTMTASALCKMADREQIQGALVDGPLAFDNAISEKAARTKGIHSSVAGKADILLTPDLEAGNMLVKQLGYFSGATSAGVVLGARVPIALTSRADDELCRMASCAVASLMYASQRGGGRG
jgi:phosphotransacetylase/acyl dehydratase